MVFIFCGSLGKLIQGLSLWCRQKIKLWHLGNLGEIIMKDFLWHLVKCRAFILSFWHF